MTLVSPLEWPITVPRKLTRAGGNYRSDGKPITVTAAAERLERELYQIEARNAELAANFGKTRGGNIARMWSWGDPGCVVRYDVGKTPYTLPCDTFSDLAQNIAALAAHLEAVRKIDRLGVATMKQAMGAFAQLPQRTRPEWWEVLEVSHSASIEVVEASYRALAKRHHPDVVGGSHDKMSEINMAMDEARKRVKK